MNASQPAPQEALKRTAAALKTLGHEVVVVATGAQAKEQALAWIPQGAEVLTVSSVTVETIGLGTELNDSGRYRSVKALTHSLDRATQGREIRKLTAAPDWVVGSVHALTEDGTALIASMTGSQQASYVFGAGTVVWIVGAQKIVQDLAEAHRRLTEEVVPLESIRARKAYGLPDSFQSFVGKLVVFQKEANPGRIKIILVEEALGH